jgi:opacity protein-like surface antigen
MNRLPFASIAAVALLSLCAPGAHAQDIGFRGFGQVGGTRFAASDSFKAVLGGPSGVIWGGGVEAIFAQNYFVNVRASRFQKDGPRVFVLNQQVFDLGVPTTVRVTPIEVSGGYRFKAGGPQLIPYAGGGIGWYRYSETADFASNGDDLKETHTGYHVLGGVEYRLSRLFGVAGELEWSTVPDALGQDPNSVSAAFDETNLGGTTFLVKVVVGR